MMILTQLDTVALLAILLIGVPHGALDIDLSLAASNSSKNRMLFYFSYIVLALGSFWLWSMLPTASLIVFLAISTVHFGRSNPFGLAKERTAKNWQLASVQFFMGGAATIFIPALYWSQAQLLFGSLGADSAVIRFVGLVALPAWIASALVSMLYLRASRVAIICVFLCALVAVKDVLSPLILFSFYFCVLHSAPHFFRAMRFLRVPISSPPPMFLVNTVIAWLFVFLAYGFYDLGDNSVAASLNAVFGVLFALTIPHMFLVDALLPRAAQYWQADFSLDDGLKRNYGN
jgi:Brp/Blh family beta-carotene 15,15'-monooxygenase